MRNFHLSLISLMIFMSSWGQKTAKDTLYFKFNSNYITVKKNYEGVHSFILKKEKLVTSAFGEIIKEDLFFFTQSGFPPKTYRLEPDKIYNLKKFFRKKKELFKDSSSKNLDAYKIMKYFEKYIVFFSIDNEFFKVKVHTSLAE